MTEPFLHTQTWHTWDAISLPDPWFQILWRAKKSGNKAVLGWNCESYVPYKSHSGTKILSFHWGRLNIGGHIATLFPQQNLPGEKFKGLWLSLRIPESCILSEVRWGWYDALLWGGCDGKQTAAPCCLTTPSGRDGAEGWSLSAAGFSYWVDSKERLPAS